MQISAVFLTPEDMRWILLKDEKWHSNTVSVVRIKAIRNSAGTQCILQKQVLEVLGRKVATYSRIVLCYKLPMELPPEDFVNFPQ